MTEEETERLKLERLCPCDSLCPGWKEAWTQGFMAPHELFHVVFMKQRGEGVSSYSVEVQGRKAGGGPTTEGEQRHEVQNKSMAVTTGGDVEEQSR